MSDFKYFPEANEMADEIRTLVNCSYSNKSTEKIQLEVKKILEKAGFGHLHVEVPKKPESFLRISTKTNLPKFSDVCPAGSERYVAIEATEEPHGIHLS